MDEVVNKLEESGVIGNSEGAKIVDLEDKGLGVCIIKKSDGTSIYATRDLAAVLYRARTYNFDKCLYVVAYEQNLHFKQVFEVAKHLGISEKCLNGFALSADIRMLAMLLLKNAHSVEFRALNSLSRKPPTK
jgi:arginyl-tRNA synthetase